MFLCNFIFNYHKSSIFLFVRLNGFAWRNSTAVKFPEVELLTKIDVFILQNRIEQNRTPNRKATNTSLLSLRDNNSVTATRLDGCY